MKYGNIKTVVDGIVFDSKKEAKRYAELKLLEKAGKIYLLVLQPEYIIAAPCVINGRKMAARKYRADFSYIQDGKEIVEDTKGMKTDMYKLKRHLMASIHGIEILET
jgi:hypothetical protein